MGGIYSEAAELNLATHANARHTALIVVPEKMVNYTHLHSC